LKSTETNIFSASVIEEKTFQQFRLVEEH